ncbi:hypothetical protein, partial [Serratia sarumanii]|uniref:hypothetical protein n=1 Tax=Serratia sarumanii TaxID=3020826 RepID=UPI003F7D0F94
LLTGDNSTFPLYYPFPCRYMINPASMLTSQDVTAFALKTTPRMAMPLWPLMLTYSRRRFPLFTPYITNKYPKSGDRF